MAITVIIKVTVGDWEEIKKAPFIPSGKEGDVETAILAGMWGSGQ